LGLRILRRFERTAADRLSRSALVHVVWPRRFGVALLGVLGVQVLALAGMVATGHVLELELALALALAACIHLLGFASIAGSGVFAPPIAAAPAIALAPRYARSGLTEAHAERIRRRLLEMMERDRPWTDPDLSLADLARRVGAPPPHVSQVLSQHLGTRFFDFVNGYRVNEVKRRLAEAAAAGRSPSILEIALEAGFSGKSSFHRVFRDAVGVTPGAWLKSAAGSGVLAKRPGRREGSPEAG
jgi:AraC-like DNA-binding protein